MLTEYSSRSIADNCHPSWLGLISGLSGKGTRCVKPLPGAERDNDEDYLGQNMGGVVALLEL
jgi:hypothetical protein